VPGLAAAVGARSTLYRTTATPTATLADGTRGLFLVESAQRVMSTGIYPGYVVLFVPDSWLLAAAQQTGAGSVQLRVGGTRSPGPRSRPVIRSSFTTLDRRFDLFVPVGAVHGSAVVLPWLILGCGLVLAALAGALGVNGARRGRAQRELDHIFRLSPDLIAVADFDGYFKRINPAFGHTLGYTEDELLQRPYLELVHPDDLGRTRAEDAVIRQGQTTMSFENRYVCKDGSFRWLEWATTPVVAEQLMYAVARDVTERRRAEIELREAQERYRRLAEEQAALRRVATLVANGIEPAELFAAVTEEVGQLLGASGA
jgi:PAS domain S-box-containing protein